LVAVIVTDPTFNAVNIPEALIDARVASEAAQVTCELKFAVVPSLYLPVAISCRVAPAETEVAEPELVTLIVARVTVGLVFLELLLLPPPQPARPRRTAKTETNKALIFFIGAILLLLTVLFFAHPRVTADGEWTVVGPETRATWH